MGNKRLETNTSTIRETTKTTPPTIEKSKITAITSDYRAIKTATLMYYSDIGQWPETPTTLGDDPGFVDVAKSPYDATEGWNGPYIDVWVDKAPLGTVYNFVNGDDGTTYTDLSAIIPGEENAIYLMIEDLPDSAHEILLADLGETIVFEDETATATDKYDVYLKIADK